MALDTKYQEAKEPMAESEGFEITYVINGWGLKNGYVAFGIRENV